eukprot:537334-Pelagomonas_calceolata.AAC.1
MYNVLPGQHLTQSYRNQLHDTWHEELQSSHTQLQVDTLEQLNNLSTTYQLRAITTFEALLMRLLAGSLKKKSGRDVSAVGLSRGTQRKLQLLDRNPLFQEMRPAFVFAVMAKGGHLEGDARESGMRQARHWPQC